ncbi:PstS family phosphate ABC transporter substrate-binding protein [Oceanobacillus halophilus]|uniref:PBP domain-containing protein n=1 Tax=Oceanobacillus halophilus TaxID=930130 RepID=A0A495A4U6_9BACI|nr:substrate-binding domain-containing protein [Oceanobacillus halophilus]RKQ34726.1 hypothetical protein D8M06_07360 [Oceanobacillus halophilus]
MKIFGSILTIIIIGFVGLVSTIIVALTRNAAFYVPFVITVTIGLIITIILAIYRQFHQKLVRRTIIIFGVSCLVALGSYEGYQAYLRSLEVVSTQDVDLSDYLPFTNNTQAVTLEEVSEFKIEDNLPKLDGATALYPVYAAFAQAVYPEENYPLEESEVVSSQTSYAFDRLLRGEADIIFIAHPSEIQMNQAKQRGLDLTLTPIGQEAFVFFVNSKNPVNELTIKQIQDIYSGKITNWKELGGNDEEILAFQRPEGSGSQTALLTVMNGIPLMKAPAEEIVSGMGGIIRETSNFQNRSNAIGFSFRYFSQDMVQNGKIKHIAIEGVEPTKKNIQNQTYPIVDSFYAITADSDNPNIEEFIQWMQSDQGQKIVDETGYVPVNR